MKKLEVKAAGIHFCVEREPMESEYVVLTVLMLGIFACIITAIICFS